MNIFNNLKKIYIEKNIPILTMVAGIMGAIIFIIIYGINVIDVTKYKWLFEMDDLTQQYIGWIFFRDADWTFPIGVFNTLSYPNYASIIYTDSIPLFAIIFKTISSILPQNFQYFGIYGLLCYVLQGVFAFTLLRKFINNKFYCIIGTIFFIISPYLLQRMFWHSALCSHFIILAAFCLFAYREIYIGKAIKKILLWSILLICAITIHLYYVPMIFIIMISSFIAEFIDDRNTIKSSCITFIIFLILTLIVIWSLGGNTSKELVNSGIYSYNINLNTFFNPQGYSSILKDLDKATPR